MRILGIKGVAFVKIQYSSAGNVLGVESDKEQIDLELRSLKTDFKINSASKYS